MRWILDLVTGRLNMIIQNEMKLDPFDKALFVFRNKNMDKLKILHFDVGFWIYYYRLERSHFKWHQNPKEELKWLLKGY